MGSTQSIEKKPFISTIEKIANGEDVDISNIDRLEGTFEWTFGEPFRDHIDYVNLPFRILGPGYTDRENQEPKENTEFRQALDMFDRMRQKKISVPFEQLLKAFEGYYYTGISKFIDDSDSGYGVFTNDIRMYETIETIQFQIPKSEDIVERNNAGEITGIITKKGVVDIKRITGDYEITELYNRRTTIGIISKIPINPHPAKYYRP